MEKTSEIETVILRVNCDDQGKIKVKNLLKKVFELKQHLIKASFASSD